MPAPARFCLILGLMVFAATTTHAQTTATTTAAPAKTPPAQTDIISDDDFNVALPPLDQTVAPPPEPTTPAPTPAEPAPTDTPATDDTLAPVAATADPDMQTPLPSLNGYDVQPLQAAANEQAPPLITYVTVVDGLHQVDLNVDFKNLSALQMGKGKAVNIAMVRARATEDEALILRLLQSRGYFDGTVHTTVSNVPGATGQVQAQLTVSPGPQYKLGLVTADAAPTQPPDLIRNAFLVKGGDPIIANNVLASEANVSLVLANTGYPFAKLGARDILLDPAAQTGDYTLKIDTGARSRFGGFRTDGKLAFDAKHVGVLTRFDKGELYDNRKVDDLRQALTATGLFSSVAVEAVPSTEKAPDGTQYVDLLVHQQKGPARTLAATVGYSTGEGFTATAGWQDRNLFPPEGALIVTGALGTQQQALSTTFRRSNDKRRDRTTQLAVSASHNVYDAYDANTFSLSGSRSRVSTPLWQKLWTWSYGVEFLATQEISADLASGNTARNIRTVYYLADVPLKVGYDKADDLLNPAKGFRLGVQTTPEVSLSGGGSPNVKTIVDGSYYHAMGAKAVIATRIRLGLQLGAKLENIAPSRRLYAGGGGSVRGYAYQGLGPTDANGDPTGGLSVFEASLEYRYRFGDFGIVPFIDIGQAYATTTPSFSDMHAGIGIGGRLYTNFGPIRIDVATPLVRDKKSPVIALYVGIGQAF